MSLSSGPRCLKGGGPFRHLALNSKTASLGFPGAMPLDLWAMSPSRAHWVSGGVGVHRGQLRATFFHGPHNRLRVSAVYSVAINCENTDDSAQKRRCQEPVGRDGSWHLFVGENSAAGNGQVLEVRECSYQLRFAGRAHVRLESIVGERLAIEVRGSLPVLRIGAGQLLQPGFPERCA